MKKFAKFAMTKKQAKKVTGGGECVLVDVIEVEDIEGPVHVYDCPAQ